MDVQQVSVSEIKLTHSYRQGLGDLNALAESIKQEGLLQPIGITPDRQLVFGKRRFLACKDVLGWTAIPCWLVEVRSILSGQFAENEMRLNFAPSERDAIRRALQIEVGHRQGKRTDLTGTPNEGELVARGPQVGNIDQPAVLAGNAKLQVLPGEKTRDATARMAGFASTTEARRVQKVMERGAPELIKAMDEKRLTPTMAAQLADLPQAEQVKAIAGGRRGIVAALDERRRRSTAARGTALQQKDVPTPQPLKQTDDRRDDLEHCKCGGQWMSDGNGGRFCAMCRASHRNNKTPYSDEDDFLGGTPKKVDPDKAGPLYGAAMHALGRAMKAVHDFAGECPDAYYQNTIDVLRQASRIMENWAAANGIPEEYGYPGGGRRRPVPR